MAVPLSKHYDAIIIGAGISGLVCGAYLAKTGMKVLVVEQHDKPGGYCTSFKRKGFLFDAAAHSFGSYRKTGNTRKTLTDLGIDKMIKVKQYSPSDIIITPNFKITIWNDMQETVVELSRIFPKEKNNIINFFNFLISKNTSEFTKLKSKTLLSLLQSFFSDTTLINALAFPVLGNGGLPPSLMHAFIGIKLFREFVVDGGYYPEGGMQSLPNALEKLLKQNRANFVYQKKVKKILYKDKAVTGIMLDNDESFTAKYIISACDGTQTFSKLLGKDIVSNDILTKLNHLIPSSSFVILYFGIKKPFRSLPPRGSNNWYLPHYDLDEYYRNTQLCNFKRTGILMIRVSPDEKTLLAFMLAPFKSNLFWRQNKRKIAGNLLGQIDTYIPDLKKNVSCFDVATPSTLYRYTLNHKGAAYGWASIPAQLFDPNFFRKSSIEGLYLTGHWTTRGFGLPGVIAIGQDTAKLILRKERLI